MGWWKADRDPAHGDPQAVSATTPSHPHPHPLPVSTSSNAESACPVDPKTRSLWLQQGRGQPPVHDAAQAPLSQAQPSLLNPPQHPADMADTRAAPRPPSQQCSSDRISPDSSPPRPDQYASPRPLSHERVVSSIPRAQSGVPLATPMNSERETGASASGHWIYPSESQFFQAVMRKQTSSNPADLVTSISHIIPIHNAVNERAWALIKEWEGNTSAACGGPKLLSFQGLGGGATSPKARLKSLVGYTEPFDRHDWVVERCRGETIEYVIDFYQGKPDARKGGDSNLNFYLDVRPKLNTLQGWRMRAERLVGWS